MNSRHCRVIRSWKKGFGRLALEPHATLLLVMRPNLLPACVQATQKRCGHHMYRPPRIGRSGVSLEQALTGGCLHSGSRFMRHASDRPGGSPVTSKRICDEESVPVRSEGVGTLRAPRKVQRNTERQRPTHAGKSGKLRDPPAAPPARGDKKYYYIPLAPRKSRKQRILTHESPSRRRAAHCAQAARRHVVQSIGAIVRANH